MVPLCEILHKISNLESVVLPMDHQQTEVTEGISCVDVLDLCDLIN